MTPAQEQAEKYAAAARNLQQQADTLSVACEDLRASVDAMLSAMEADAEPIGTVEDLPLYTTLSNGYALIFNGNAGPMALPIRDADGVEICNMNGIPYYATVDDTLTPALQELL